MSVSIVSKPFLTDAQESLESANNPSVFTVASDNSTLTDYLYVADVYVNGTKSVTLKSYPDPAFGFGLGVFDLNSIANKYVSYDFPAYSDNTIIPIVLASNSYCTIQLKFREQYVSGSTFIQSTGTTDTPIFNYSNASLSFVNSASQAVHLPFYTYLFASDFLGGFWLMEPIRNYFPDEKIFKIANPTLKQWLYYFAYSGEGYVHIQTQDKNGTEVGHYVITDPFTTTTGMRYVQAGVPQLLALDPTAYSVFSGPSAIINDSVVSYNMTFSYSPTVEGNNTTPFTIIPECTKFHDIYSVYWLNSLGGFDSCRFARRNVTTLTKNQVSAKQRQGSLNSDGEFITNSFDSSTINFYTEYTTAIQLNSDWLSDMQVIILQDLFTSPAIFIEDQYGVIQAATLGDNSYPINKIINGTKAYSLQLNLNLSSTSYRQLL